MSDVQKVRAGDLRRGDRIPRGFLPPTFAPAVVEDVIAFSQHGEQWACVLATPEGDIPDRYYFLADRHVPVGRTPAPVPAGIGGIALSGRAA